MKTVKNSLSLLLAMLMILSVAQPLSPGAFAKEPGTEIVYGNKTGTRQQAEAEALNYTEKNVAADYYKSNLNKFRWQHTHTLTMKDNEGLRGLLTSTDPEDTYIALDGDADRCSIKTKCETIVISADKVLDLNGHKITMRDDTNIALNEASQADDYEWHNSTFIRITGGATLTIIDSSMWRPDAKGQFGTGTGGISITGRMIYPFEHEIKHYTTRDLFLVENGNLVIYGGTFQAGRQKGQAKKKFSWEKLKATIGHAVGLAANVMEYASGVDLATSALEDVNDAFKNTPYSDTSSKDDGKDDILSSSLQRTGADAKAEAQKQTSNEAKRDLSVSEKMAENGKTGENKADSSNAAKQDEKNSKLAQARKEVGKSVVNQKGIEGIVGGVFQVIDDIADMIGTDYKTRLTETIFGTVVRVQNNGTFVSYGGKFIGYGSTANVRDAVVEVHKTTKYDSKRGKYEGGLAYIYGGTFEGCAGANIFNFVQAKTVQKRWQMLRDDYGNTSYTVKTLPQSETNNLQVLTYEGDPQTEAEVEAAAPVNTCNVVVRGGTFRNYYEYKNLSIKDPNDKDGKDFTWFYGTPGSVGLGIQSFGEDMIKDGRIQIVDSYGDGNLVLMDEHTGDSGDVCHYRLFCSDLELRYKRYLDVRPNTAQTNATHTLSLRSKYMESGAVTRDNAALPFTSSGENDRTAGFSRTERAFLFPLDSKNTPNFYIVPDLGATDPFGTDLDTSSVWYYAEPKNTKGNKIPNLLIGETSGIGTPKDGRSGTSANQRQHNDSDWKKIVDRAKSGSMKYTETTRYMKTNVKWYTYKIYRVDPLTRDNISESSVWGVDAPLCTVSYGSSDDSLRCKMTLKKLEEYMKSNCGFAGFKSGEIYRVTFTVEETLKCNYISSTWAATALPTATASSSILFQCYNSNEIVNMGGAYGKVDFTPLQWTAEPHVDRWAGVQLVNGKAGLADYDGNKIFDVYYQWYAIDALGRHNLIAGTDNVYKGSREDKWKHDITHWNVGSDGKRYVNTVDPRDPKAKNYVNGLPKNKNDWTDKLLHAYTDEITDHNLLKSNVTLELDHTNNRAFETNSDSCYIPKVYAGCKVYVKAIVVNTYWQSQFDHVQVFYSRPVQLEEPEPDPIVFYTAVKPSTANGMISKADPATLSIDTLTGLAKGETVTSVTYIAGGYAKTFKNLKATEASALPTAKYPQDFIPAGTDPCPRQITLNAFVTISSNRGEGVYEKAVGFYTAKKQTFSFDQKVQYLAFNKNNGSEIKISVDDANDTGALRKALHAYFFPGTATYGGTVFSQNVTYTTENAMIASLKKDGSLNVNGSLGKTKITLLSPDGTRPSVTVHVVKPLTDVYVTGLNEPTVGGKFDYDVQVPADAPYTVRNVVWTDEATGETLPKSATAQNFRYYTAHVSLAPKANVEAGLDVNVHGTVDLKDGKQLTDAGDAWAQFDDTNNRFIATSFHFTYTFAVVPEGTTKTTVDKLFVTFPDSPAEGSSIDVWKEQVSFTTDVKDAPVSMGNVEMTYGYCGTLTAENMGYGPNFGKKTFIPDVQQGFTVIFSIPDGSPVTFGSNIEIYVNGRRALSSQIYRSSRSLTLAAGDALTVTGGEPVQPNTDAFRIKDFNLWVGKEFRLSELLETDSEFIRLRSATDTNGYYTYDDDTGIFKALIQMTAGGGVNIPIYVDFDRNCDGKADATETFTVKKQIHPNETQANRYPPVKTQQKMALVTVKDPTGNELSYRQVYSDGYGTDEYLTIPAPDGRLVLKVEDDYGEVFPLTAKGVKATGMSVGKALTATVSDTGVIPRPGATEVYADAPADAKAMLYSLDGVRWTANDHFTGLTPETQYTLYYRQTAKGTIYEAPFKTAREFYGVYVGKTPVTNENMGNSLVDGWMYSRTMNWLYLKDITLYTTGSEVHENRANADNYSETAVIRAEGDLTLFLIGDNRIVTTSDSPANNRNAVVCGGNLSVQGVGDLTMDVDTPVLNRLGNAFVCGGDVTFNLGGTITINNYARGIKFTNNGTFFYRNADVDYNALYYEYINGYYIEAGSFMDAGAKYDFEDRVHAITFKTGRNEGNCTMAEWASANGAGKSSRIVPTHDSGRNSATPEGLVSGNCLTSTSVYHKVCACGALLPATFTVASSGKHSYETYNAVAPTCTRAGYKEFRYCTLCGDMNYQPQPALGHNMQKVNPVAPTCTEEGFPAYTKCAVCGLSADKPTPAEVSRIPVYAAHGHNLTLVSGSSKCLAAGTVDHYACADCGKLFRDADGLIPLSADEIKLSAAGHTWSEWKVTKAPTAAADGASRRECLVCGTAETAVIPKGSKLVGGKPAFMLGDVNGDGSVTTADARFALRAAIGLEKYDAGTREFLAADVNKDNTISTGDARFILRHAIGLKDPEIKW